MSPMLVEGPLDRRLERLSLVTRRRLVGQGQGDSRSLRRGSSLEFGAGVAETPRRSSGMTILLSDLLSPSWDRALMRLASRTSEVVVLHTLAPQELRPALCSDARLIDRETGATVSVTLNSDAIRI